MIRTRITVGQAVHEYLKWYDDGRRAASTVREAAQMTRPLVRKYGHLQTQSIQNDHMTSLFRELKRPGPLTPRGQWAPNTFNGTLFLCKRVFTWFQRKGWARPVEDLFEGVHPLVVPERHFVRLSAEQVDTFVSAAKNPRDRIFFVALLNTVQRSGDTRSLTIDSLDRSDNAMWFIKAYSAKTKKIDLLPVTPHLRQELETWLGFYEEQCGPLQGDWFLIPAKHKPRVRGTGKFGAGDCWLKPEVQFTAPFEIVRQALIVSLGFDPKGEKCHVMRRTASRRMFDAMIESGRYSEAEAISVVQKTLQHSTVKQTRHYIGWDSEIAARQEFLSGWSVTGGHPSPPATDVQPNPAAQSGEPSNVIDLRSRKRVI